MGNISKKILLADDNDANRLIASTILERSGYDVTTAQNGAQAIAMAQQHKFDLIVLDIIMPVMNGVRALRLLRRDNNPNQSTTAFALTAFCSPQDQQRYILAGFDFILAKPLKPGDIEKALSSYQYRNTLSKHTTPGVLPSSSVNLIDENITSQILRISDKESLETIQSRFWSSIFAQCEIIEKSLANAIHKDSLNLSQFRRAVHMIMGASATIGLARVAHITRRLQNAPPAEISTLVSNLIDALAESRPALDEALSGARKLDPTMKVSGEDEPKAAHHDQYYRSAV